MSAFNFNSNPGWRNHVCGLYYTSSNIYQHQLEKTYLPQVELQAHTSILSTTSRTTLAQTFMNPSKTMGIKKVTYTFPLYDGVSVVGFVCHVGGRVIVGEVKEKEKARAVFTEAVARGETAALLEQLPDASDVFTTTIGNIPAGAEVVIHITYLGELKHDMEVDGIRFTIPNIICPRYGNTPIGIFNHTSTQGTRISITVDAEMPDSSFIQQISSPSHPIAINMGTTSLAPNSEPSMNKASASLGLGTAQLDTDFVLQIIAKDTSVPKAIWETHPTIPNQRALMVTLVPKFSLPSEKPEIVFVCDRSGSMGGSRIKLVVQALKVFLKSLPIGVKFNICSFGSHYSFLWPKSVTYNQEHLNQAMSHADSFSGDYGGTEMLEPLKATLQQRYKDIPLEVVLLTDGEIWRPETLFEYLNQEITNKKAPIRIFTLGIGNGVSHSLIEGVAKAGNGFSQAVAEGEKMDQKVVRMLKGALSPHVTDYTLEVKYTDKNKMAGTDEGEDEYEIIEKVADSLKVKLHFNEKAEKSVPVKTISLFDTSINLDKEEPTVHDETGESRYAHLPRLAVPNIIQAPQQIPSLFAFNRTTVYLLLGPNAPQKTPRSVVLRGTSVHGQLELEIPVQMLDTPGETVHQLAAKKAIAELEQGRGWLRSAKDESGKPVKEVFESRFEDMVEREAVRLGVQFQVGGKWCSFVAVEKTKSTVNDNASDGWLDEANISKQTSAPNTTVRAQNDRTKANRYIPGAIPQSGGLFGNSAASPTGRNSSFNNSHSLPHMALYSQPQQTGFSPSPFSFVSAFGAPQSQQAAHMMAQQQQQPRAFAMNQMLAGMPPGMPQQSSLGQTQAFAHTQMAPAMPQQSSPGQTQGNHVLQDYQMQMMLLEQQNKKRLLMARQEQDNMSYTPPTNPSPPSQPQGNHALQDYPMQLQLLEAQNRKRQLMAQQEQESKLMSSPSTSTAPTGMAALMAPAPVDSALLEQYQREMSDAAHMPLPDEDDEDDKSVRQTREWVFPTSGDKKDRSSDINLGPGNLGPGTAVRETTVDLSRDKKDEPFDLNLGFGEGDALESFDFDSFLNLGDSKDAYDSNDFGFGNPPAPTPVPAPAFGAQWSSPFGSTGPPPLAPTATLFGNAAASATTSTSPFASPAQSASIFSNASTTNTSKGFGSAPPSSSVFGTFGSATPSSSAFGGPAAPAGNLFGGQTAPAGNPFGRPAAAAPVGNLFGRPAAPAGNPFGRPGPVAPDSATLLGEPTANDSNPFMTASSTTKSSGSFAFPMTSNTSPMGFNASSVTKNMSKDAKPQTDDELLDAIIALQTFEGSWEWSEQLFDIIGVSKAVAENELRSFVLDIGKKQLATALAVAFLERRLVNLKGTWELVVEKAVGWLGEESEKIVGLAVGVMEKS